MIWCDVARMLIIGSVPLAAAFGALPLGQLYAVAIAVGVCTVFFDVPKVKQGVATSHGGDSKGLRLMARAGHDYGVCSAP
jgi:hypothetical protein